MRYLILILVSCLAAFTTHAQKDFSKVEITAEKINDHLYMLQGAGGNIMISMGDDGVMMIDDQFAPLSEKIMVKIKELTGGEVNYLINTHWHGDHTGGNENFGNAGATIIAHDNVRKRMARGLSKIESGRDLPPAPATALPVITFSKDMKLHFNGDEIHLFHFHSGHTDGDGIIYLPGQNVIHMGDTFFKDKYPFIDLKSGGSVDGLLKNIQQVLFMIDEETIIIPGHGAIANKADLIRYKDVIFELRDKVAILIKQGKSQDEIMDAEISAAYDENWGSGFINGETFIGFLYKGLTQSKME